MKPNHPYTEIWPILGGESFDKFKADIAANGQRLPILLYKDMILDGRNRQRACQEVGITPRYEDAGVTSDAEALAVVVSFNEHRRHLSKDQRALAAEAIANIIHGHNRHVEKIVELSKDKSTISTDTDTTYRGVSLVAAARAMDVPPISVSRMRAVRTHGGKAAVDEVLSGKISLTTQAKKVTPPRETKEKRAKRPGPGRPRKGTIPPVMIVNPLPLEKRRPDFATIEEHRRWVDPEFKGTPIEFTDKYGHVQVMTAEQYATERFGAWAFNMSAIAKEAKRMPDWPNVDHNWVRSPRARDIAKMAEALDYLRAKIAEAEALLQRARALQPQHQPNAESLLTE